MSATQTTVTIQGIHEAVLAAIPTAATTHGPLGPHTFGYLAVDYDGQGATIYAPTHMLILDPIGYAAFIAASDDEGEWWEQVGDDVSVSMTPDATTEIVTAWLASIGDEATLVFPRVGAPTPSLADNPDMEI